MSGFHPHPPLQELERQLAEGMEAEGAGAADVDARLALYDRMVSRGVCHSHMDEPVQKGWDTMWERGWRSTTAW